MSLQFFGIQLLDFLLFNSFMIMKTEAELNENIVKMTMTIRNEFPELMKFLSEMPVTIPNSVSPEINVKILQDYYDSLEDLLRKYAPNHDGFINKF